MNIDEATDLVRRASGPKCSSLSLPDLLRINEACQLVAVAAVRRLARYSAPDLVEAARPILKCLNPPESADDDTPIVIGKHDAITAGHVREFAAALAKAEGGADE